MSTLKRNAGFTLIELMIVIAIVGILATIAYPSYTEQIKKGRRSDAKSALLNVQMAEEKYRTNNTSYGTLAQIGTPATDYYTIAVSNPTATSYTATATPSGTQADDKCGTFAINQDGKTTFGSIQTSQAKVQECWGK